MNVLNEYTPEAELAVDAELAGLLMVDPESVTVAPDAELIEVFQTEGQDEEVLPFDGVTA